MSDELRLSSHRRPDGIPVLVAAGEIDMTNAQAFRHALAEAAGHDGQLVVDLTGVDYLDSAGLAALFAQVPSVRLELLVNEVLVGVLDISGLSRVTSVRT